jgi:hypothetical protein
MSQVTTRAILAAAVATSGTFTVAYPVGFTAGHFKTGKKHLMNALQRSMEAPKDFTISFGATVATITYLGATTIPAGSEVFVQFDAADMSEPNYTSRRGLTTNALGQQRLMFDNVVGFHLGSPVASSTTALRAAAAIGGAGLITLLAAGQVFDVPRNVQITSSGNDSGTVYTVTGRDEYGAVVVSTITGPNTTTVQGTKAYKSITSISASVTPTGNISIGFGNVLGLPAFIGGAGNIIREILDGAVATAGTLVAGVVSTATAATGDVRGTYVPNSAPDGSRTYQLVVYLEEPTYLGAPQFGS